MRNFSTWLLVMFIVIFWVFRVIVAVGGEFGFDVAGITPLNPHLEIVLLFVVLACIVLIVKRKILGALIYLLAYGMYFGADVITKLGMILEGNTLGINEGFSAFVSILGIILPIMVLLDMLADKARKANPVDKKTDWFYKNEDFDRKLDERSDKNNYRTM